MNQDNNAFIPNNNFNSVNNNNQEVSNGTDKIICSRCGSEMRKDARYCMKCGNLNYSHPENESMRQYAQKDTTHGYSVSGTNSDYQLNKIIILKAKSIRKCLVANIILHLLMGVGSFLLFSTSNNMTSSFVMAAFVSAIVFIINYSMQVVYIKAGEPWWGYFVPFYSNYLLYKIAFGNGWIFLTLFLPIIGGIFSLIALYNLGKKFYKNGWLMILFPFVMIPIIAFDKKIEYSMLESYSSFYSSTIGSNGKTKSENEYGRNKVIITIISIILVSVILYFVWPYLKLLVERIYDFFLKQLEFFK